MSFSDFIHINGYGLYIWSSFGMAAALVIAELISLQVARSRAIREVNKTVQLNRDHHESQT